MPPESPCASGHPRDAIANLCYIKGYTCLSIITDHIIMDDKNYLSLKRESLF
jgi:hypothetical protein